MASKLSKYPKTGGTAPVHHDEPLDCLLVHAAKTYTFFPPLNVYQSCNRMAMGLLALAELGVRNGVKTKVLHTGIEQIVDKKFSFKAYLEKMRPKTVGFSLHFHHSLTDTLKLAQIVRETLPHSYVFLGGFTASFFSEELLAQYPYIDAVIHGDAEKPMLELLQAVLNDGERHLDQVPNLVWRGPSTIHNNTQTYLTDESTLNDLSFTHFELLEHSDQYLGIPTAYVKTNLPLPLERFLNRIIARGRQKTYWGLPVGRGCLSHCFYCGGGSGAQNKICARKGVIFRSPERVIDTIERLIAIGYRECYISFDPHPMSQDYYLRLFALMRNRKVQFGIRFSAWGLPSKAFIDAFAKTAAPGSRLMISPETGSDHLREKYHSRHYSNDQLLDTLAYADNLGVRTVTFFSIGIPGETYREFQQTLSLKKTLMSRLQHGRTEAFLIEIEPCAPWQLNPKKYGINCHRNTLEDFIADQASPTYSSMSNLGYTSAFFGDAAIDPATYAQRMLMLRDKEFYGQYQRNQLMSIAWSIGRLAGLVPSPGKQALPTH